MQRFRPGHWAIIVAVLFALCFSVSYSPARAEEPEKKATAEEMTPPQPAKPTAEQVAATTRDASSTRPPKTGKMVGNHWTPYSPPDPESFPAGSQVHIIEPHDTLWDLSAKYLTNAWLWPQIWDVNQYITDSHWIYPGDPLLVPPRPVVVTQAGENAGVPAEIVPQGQEGAPPTELGALEGPESGEENQGAPEPLAAAPDNEVRVTKSGGRPSGGSYPGGVSKSDSLVDIDEVRCAGYISEDDKRNDLYIAENDEPSYEGVTVGTLLYLSRGKDDPRMVPGATFSIVEREGTVLHPASGRNQGTYYRRNGEVTVLKVLADTSIASVSFACDEIRIGDALVPVDAHAVPVKPIPPFDRLRTERNGKATGTIIHTRDTMVHVATGSIVQIDLGSEDGLQPGDFLTAFTDVHADRKHWMPPYDFKYGNEVFSLPDLHQDDGREYYPELPVAQLVVVSAGAHNCTAKIVTSIREVAVGSMVEID